MGSSQAAKLVRGAGAGEIERYRIVLLEQAIVPDRAFRVTWHDGKPFTGKDVQCTFHRLNGIEVWLTLLPVIGVLHQPDRLVAPKLDELEGSGPTASSGMIVSKLLRGFIGSKRTRLL